MKKLLLSTAVLTLMTASALAADLPSRKAPILPPPPPPPPMWTGFYAGLNAGYGFGTNNNLQSAAFGMPGTGDYAISFDSIYYGQIQTSLASGLALSGSANNNQNGFVGGGQIGYNYQWGSSIIIGLEADIQGAGIRGTSRHANAATEVVAGLDEEVRPYQLISNTVGVSRINTGVDWLGAVRGRVGYLFTPTLLLYATGGLTYGGVYANVSNAAFANTGSIRPDGTYRAGPYNHTFIGGGAKSQTAAGWNVGGGIEWMFMPNWSLKAEGIYWNMGSVNVPTWSTASAPCPSCDSHINSSASFAAVGATRVNYQGVIARAGINYHFNFGDAAPVVAKY